MYKGNVTQRYATLATAIYSVVYSVVSCRRTKKRNRQMAWVGARDRAVEGRGREGKMEKTITTCDDSGSKMGSCGEKRKCPHYRVCNHFANLPFSFALVASSCVLRS